MNPAPSLSSQGDLAIALETLLVPPAEPTVSSAPPEDTNAEQDGDPRQPSLGPEDADCPGHAAVRGSGDAETDVADAPSSEVEKRSSFRHLLLQHVQLLGITNDERPSDSDRFREVFCEDLSTGGAAVFLKDAPNFEKCIIELSPPSGPIYLLARIAHIEPVFRIGCQFLQRIQRDPDTGEWVGVSSHDGEEEVPVLKHEDGMHG